MNRRTRHELGLGLAAGDREAAFRLQQRLRGKMSAHMMAARGWPNLIAAREKQRRARLTVSPPVAEPRHLRCWWCGFGQMSVLGSPCVACRKPLSQRGLRPET